MGSTGELAARVGASFRLASFAVRARPPFTSGVGTEADRDMVEQWVQEIEAAGRAALDQIPDLAAVPRELETVVGNGES